MYRGIYFDLDGTLVVDNLVSGKSELLDSGYQTYGKLRNKYPEVPIYLFTNRSQKEIKYPPDYRFDKAIGKDTMIEFIEKNWFLLSFRKLLSPKNFRIFLTGYFLYRRGETAKILYLFFKHTLKGEAILVVDDDRRVSNLFGVDKVSNGRV